MKKYLADLLTLTRFILTISLIIITFTGGNPETAFLLFVFGELTDAFDGTCATRWPFPKNKTPKYRKYAAKYDMFTDLLLIAAMILFFLVRINWLAGLILGLGYGLISLIVELIVYGKLMGHPDDARPNSLTIKNFPLAKKIILLRRAAYLALIAIIATWTLYVSAWPLVVKIVITVVALFVAVFLWFFLAQRRHNISRDAVKIEKELSSRHKK